MNGPPTVQVFSIIFWFKNDSSFNLSRLFNITFLRPSHFFHSPWLAIAQQEEQTSHEKECNDGSWIPRNDPIVCVSGNGRPATRPGINVIGMQNVTSMQCSHSA